MADEQSDLTQVNEIFAGESSEQQGQQKTKGLWRRDNRIVLLASVCGANELGSNKKLANLHDVQINMDMHHFTTRKLISESHLVFSSLQQMRGACSEQSLGKGVLLKFSKKYRSILHSNFLELQMKVEDSDNPDNILIQQLKLYKIMELIWSLCEILFVESPPDGVILLQLVEWCKWHFPTADELVQECTNSSDEASPEQHPNYWNAIYSLIFQGRVTEARNMLKLHAEYQIQVYDAFSSIDELLRKMPLFSYHQGQSVGEFEMKWKHWQDECIKRLDDGDFDSNSELKLLCRILCGDKDAFVMLSELCGSWYIMLVSYLLYTNPTISLYDLHYHSKLCIDIFGGHAELGALDTILLAALKFDVSQVVHECCTHFSNWWLPTHLTDLLFHSELFPPHTTENDTDLREFLLVTYANCLSSLDSLWNVGANYLSCSGQHSLNYLTLYVERIPITSEKKASKILRLCEKHGLSSVAQSVCKQMIMKSIQHGHLGNALLWCVKANNASTAMYVADKMLEEYAKHGSFVNLDVVDYLGPTILMSERLTFLGKYREFHKLYADKRFRDAGLLLLNLLVSRIAPVNLWLSLLMDALPLLEGEKLIYGVQETSSLLACLNKLDQHSDPFRGLSETEKFNHIQKMKHLRLALTNNLARAVVHCP